MAIIGKICKIDQKKETGMEGDFTEGNEDNEGLRKVF